MPSLVFRVNNELALSSIAPGRCLSLCCEWATVCCSTGIVNNATELSDDHINEGQILYETQYQNERVLAEKHFRLTVSGYQRQQIDPTSGIHFSKCIASCLLNEDGNQLFIIGLSVSEKKGDYGHAVAGRVYWSEGIKQYEFIDPSFGLYRSSDKQEMLHFIVRLLKEEYRIFLPINIKNQYWITTVAVYHPSLPSTPTNTQIEEEIPQISLPPLKAQRKALIAINNMISPQQRKEWKIPPTGNKMAKLKKKEFQIIFQSFTEVASKSQVIRFTKEQQKWNV